MQKPFKACLSLLLALVLALAAAAPAFASYYKAEEDEKPALVTKFNAAVNSLKTETPRAKVTYKNYVPEGGITTGTPRPDDPTVPTYGTALDEMGTKYLIPVLEGMFNNRSSLSKSFILALLGDGSAKPESVEVHAGAPRDNAIPLYGKKTVSELTAAADYDIVYEENDVTGEIVQMGVVFPSVMLEDAKTTSLPALFSLPSGQIDPVIISGQPTAEQGRLAGAELTHFSFDNARAVVRFGADGRPIYYGTQIDYHFSLSFYDCMNLLSALLGYNFYTAVMYTVNDILVRVGREGVDAESVMRDRVVFVTYRSIMEVTDIVYEQRLFGDVDGDGAVTATDARAALRDAVELELIASPTDAVYADVDFDGQITAADARAILRMAVALDPTFKDVPAGKKILISRTEPPAEEIDQEELEQEREQFNGILGGWQPNVKLSEITDKIMDIIDAFMDTAGEGRSLITDFIEAIKEEINEGRTKPKP